MLVNDYEGDITRGTLLLIERGAVLKSNSYISRFFEEHEYCLYLGYNRGSEEHHILCNNQTYQLNQITLMSKTYIIQN